MKLQKLTIHNIASFEDAVIDFEKYPLDTADVFLISGNTGSGKSTILDSICMALYGKTPRIEESDTTTVYNRHEGITLTDPRRFLRRNAGEGFVALRFQASGINFEARWGVKRARNKPTGALQKREWTLTDLDKNHKLTYESEIKERIGELVGLDYDQFCRTTMLSQGEFDKFLRSKESEKAEILQKITGADIYERIGARIYAVTKQHKDAYDLLRIKLDSVKVLTDEEICTINQQIADFSKQSDDIVAQVKEHTENRTWLLSEAELAKKVAELAEKLQAAKDETQTDDFRAAQTDIAQYDATGEARTSLRQIAEQQNTVNTATAKVDALSNKFAALLADCAAFKDVIDKVKSELVATHEKIVAEQSRKVAYDSVGEICTALSNALVADEKAVEYQNNAAQLTEANKTAEAKLAKLQQEYNRNVEALELAIEHNRQTQAEIDKVDVKGLRDSKDRAQKALTDIANALNAIEIYKTKEKVVADIRDSLKKCDDDKREQELKLATAQGALVAKKDALKNAEITRNKQRDAAGDSAEALRSSLMPGDTCPVCGQLISNILPVADALKDMLRVANEAYEKADAEYQKALENVQVCNGQIKADVENIVKYKAQLDKANTDHSSAREAMEMACGKTSVGFTDINQTTANLKAEQGKLDEKIKALTGSINEIEKKQQALNQAVSLCEKDRKKYEKDAEQINKLAKKQIEDVAAVEKCKALAVEQTKLAETSRNQAVALLGDSVGWENDAARSSAKFINELKAKKAAYDKLTELAERLDKELNNKTMQADEAGKAVARVIAIQPQWAEVTPSMPTGARDVADAINRVAADVKSSTDSIAAATSALSVAQTALSAFHTDNPDITSERLTYLAALTDADVLALRKKIEELNNNINTCQGALNQVSQQHEQHRFNRPKALYESPEITAEQLTESIEKLEEERTRIGKESGALQEKISANNQAVEQRRNELEACDKAKAVFERWKQLNDMLGDSEGKKFRTIALSYVLNSLIRSANVYMSRLTDRYVLSVQPGTFIILVTDAYQGYVTRTANTISGGETFLVSLALALALSDLGSVSGIDTLFIDEGFGTLSGEPLQKAVETLRLLHSNHRRRVGIISHVAELRERIPVQIQVTQSDRTAASRLAVIP